MTDADNVRERDDGDKPKLSRAEKFCRNANASMAAGIKLIHGYFSDANEDDSTVTMTFELDDRFNNTNGFICGGYVANMLDQVGGAVASFVSGRPTPTVEMKINFLSPAPPGKYRAVGTCLKAGKTLAVTEARVYDEKDKLIAIAQGTQQIFAKYQALHPKQVAKQSATE